MCETHANNVEIGEDRRGPTTLSGSTYEMYVRLSADHVSVQVAFYWAES